MSAVFIALVLAFGVITAVNIQKAYALKNLFNCISNASKGGKLTFDDYVKCFDQQFHGQLNGPAHSGDSVKP